MQVHLCVANSRSEEDTSCLARIFPIHHLLAWHSGRNKNALFMQCPNDLDLDAGNEVCSGLSRIDQTKRSICPDITAEQPAFIQLFNHVSFCPSSHGRRVSRARTERIEDSHKKRCSRAAVGSERLSGGWDASAVHTTRRSGA